MPLWGGTDVAGNSAIFAPSYINLTPNTANKTAMFGNTSLVNGRVVGLWGMTAAEKTGANSAVFAPGWVIKTQGSGYVSGFSVTAGGSGYSNTDLVTVPSYAGGINATATLTTNSTGGIVSTVLANTGAGFVVTTGAVSVTNSSGGASAGTGATLSATYGGRAGRVSFETIASVATLS